MIYLIVGVIISLIGLGISNADVSGKIKLLGVIIFIVGVAIGLKGRKKLDKFMGKNDR